MSQLISVLTLDQNALLLAGVALTYGFTANPYKKGASLRDHEDVMDLKQMIST